MSPADPLPRYNRQIMLDEIGPAGQQRLQAAKVLIVGAGGLGSPAAYYLAAAGIGRLTIVDDDLVELSNLHRQILHTTDDIGCKKSASARRTLFRLNPDCRVTAVEQRFDRANGADLVAGHQVVLDCTDNFASKFLINDCCVAAGVALVHGGILGWSGQLMTVLPGKSACYRCLFGEEPAEPIAKERSSGGVLGVVPGVIGTLQAAEALKYLLAVTGLLADTLLTCDLRTMRFRPVALRRRPTCPTCK